MAVPKRKKSKNIAAFKRNLIKIVSKKIKCNYIKFYKPWLSKNKIFLNESISKLIY